MAQDGERSQYGPKKQAPNDHKNNTYIACIEHQKYISVNLYSANQSDGSEIFGIAGLSFCASTIS